MNSNLLVIFILASSFCFATTREWKYSVTGHITRCFEASEVRVYCEDLEDVKTNKVEARELQIEVNVGTKKFIYSYGKGIEGDLCLDHLRQIKKIMKNVNEVCITGVGETDFNKSETYSHWVGFESRHGEVLR